MLSEITKQEIQRAYTTFLESKNLKARYGQKLMIAEIAKTLGSIELDEENHRISGCRLGCRYRVQLYQPAHLCAGFTILR